MKGAHKFCPNTGVDLSDEQHYDNRGQPRRAPVPDESDEHWGNAPLGYLTNGELVSDRYALANYFRRMHQRHQDADDKLYRSMALALRRLKTNTDAWDVWVWYALAERLSRRGYNVEWMFSHAEARCLHCSGPLKREVTARGLQVKCAQNCRNQWNQEYLDSKIKARIRAVYNSTFSDNPISKLQTVE